MPYALEPGPYLQVSLTDTGKGMDAETQKRIFEPFFTTKEPGKGTGLGMASVYGIVKHHRGAINVYSEVGRGTCIRVYLPLALSGTAVPESGPIRESTRGASRILVVEDEELVSEMVTEMLESLGYRVHLCRDGQDAVAFYRESWREVDLVILDLIMPRLGGKDTFAALRAINPGVGVLVSSGFSVEGEAQSLLDLGALGFLQKPYQKTELAQKLQEALGRM
jgi:CheY-like chemotaxis protein